MFRFPAKLDPISIFGKNQYTFIVLEFHREDAILEQHTSNEPDFPVPLSSSVVVLLQYLNPSALSFWNLTLLDVALFLFARIYGVRR